MSSQYFGGAPIVVAYGGGLNSTAMLVEWARRGLPAPGRILFADTGGERPEVYAFVEAFSGWLVAHGYPPVETIRKGGRIETLEENCKRMKMLPSLAYGRKGCSHKFKIEPQEREINRWAPARAAWKAGNKVIKLIGYGYEEQRRIALAKIEDEKYRYFFPLNYWRMDREACSIAIRAAGLPKPSKSACFFCPASTVNDVLSLAIDHPDLADRAIAMERLAVESGNLKTVKGLGRRFAWQTIYAGKQAVRSAGGASQNPSTGADACLYCIDE